MYNLKLLLITLLFVAMTINANDDLVAKIEFTDPISAEELSNFSKDGLKILNIQGKFKIGGIEHTEFLILNFDRYDSDFIMQKITDKYILDSRKSFYNAVIKHSENVKTVQDFDNVTRQFKSIKVNRSVISEMKKALLKYDLGNVSITNLTAIISNKNFNHLVNKNIDKIANISKTSSDLYFSRYKKELQEANKDDNQQRELALSSDPAPIAGYSFTGQSTDDATKRYTLQYHGWLTNTFSSDQTYEHDWFLYNYDGQTYLNGYTTPSPYCWPAVTYAASSYPTSAHPYVDTRLDQNGQCSVNELAFTIGSGQANQIPANVWQYTYLETLHGLASSDNFKINGQIGHQSPLGCQSVWCSFPDYNVILVPAWNSTVPGEAYWQR